MSIENYWPRAHLFIQATKSLEDTASELNRVLNIQLIEDEKGKLEEYPGYLAENAGLSFTLFGIPVADIREEKDRHQHFVLTIAASRIAVPKRPTIPMDLSSYYSEIITKNSDLICWEMSKGKDYK